MMRRLLRFLFTGIVAAVAVIGALAAFSYYFPPQYEATARVADSSTEVIVHMEAMHPYLAEYRRSLLLHRGGIPDQRVEMFPDTGGYARTQLYRLPDGTLSVRGFFDAFTVDLIKHTIVPDNEPATRPGVYLGAFDETAEREWRFIGASQSPEQKLVAKGG